MIGRFPSRLLAAATLLVCACGGRVASEDAAATEAPAHDEVYVGTVFGTDAVVAVVIEGSNVIAYVCGGAKTLASHTRWFSGTGDASAPIRLSTDDWTFAATASGSVARGTLTHGSDAPLTWTAQLTDPTTLAGLYATTDDGCRTGVVITQTNAAEVPLFQGAWCNRAGARMQVTPLRPYVKLHDRLAVSVHLSDRDHDRRLFVTPVSPGLH